MILTATVCFLAGAVLGLKFNVKMLAHASILLVAIWSIAGISGLVSVAGAMGDGLIGLVSLQIGYFATLLLASMGFMDQRSTAANAAAAKTEKLDASQLVQTQNPL